MFKVYQKVREEEQKPTLLELEETAYGCYLNAVDENGKLLPRGRILLIKEDGTIKLCREVSEKLGFKLDNQRQVVIGS
jgi:hypothetical protein